MFEEKRYCARHQLELPVYIRYHKRPFLTATARSVSAGGMFLSVKALTLPTGTQIELELRTLGKRWLLPAIVIHGDNSGIGVMFQTAQTALFQALTDDANATLPPVLAADTADQLRA
ncbi:MAG: pilus assembly protein PilZ [Halochromatium sp.]|nr:pilus assembly protein PilZ [Halochromatium sp.]